MASAEMLAKVETIPRDQWPVAADQLERVARKNRCLGKYWKLICQLRRGVIGERCDERAAQALRKLG